MISSRENRNFITVLCNNYIFDLADYDHRFSRHVFYRHHAIFAILNTGTWLSDELSNPPPKIDTHRLIFSKDEARLTWLSLLLEMYHTTNQGVAQGIRQGERQGRKLPCARGCATCCRSHSDILVYPLELMGIAWFATEQLSGELREKVQQQLAQHRANASCPFLVDEACSFHPLRPMACRHFNVFDRVCAEGEDAFHTRREDVLTPVVFHKDKTLAMMLRHHQVPTETERKARVANGSVHSLAQSLREVRWENLALRMAATGKKNEDMLG